MRVDQDVIGRRKNEEESVRRTLISTRQDNFKPKQKSKKILRKKVLEKNAYFEPAEVKEVDEDEERK